MFDSILRSSTPDGVAPISLFALYIFIYSFAGLAILWGTFNFIQLFKIGPDNQQQGLALKLSQTDQINQMTNKIIHGSFNYAKFNFIMIAAAQILFLLAIMAGIQQFNSFDLSVVYVLGSVAAALCSVFTLVVSSFSYSKIIYSSRYSTQGAFAATKYASNSITFVTIGITLASLMGIMIYYDPSEKRQPQQINRRGDMLICFAFGYTTVCIITKITSLIYSKVSHLFKNIITKDQKHPQVICKAIGQTVNKSLSKTLDFITVITILIGVVTKCAGMNVIGSDQNGQIIFQLNSDNTFIAFLLFGFGLFFIIMISLYIGAPQNQSEVKMHFKIHIVAVSIFLSGFTALACYLTLPAEFQISQFIKQKNFDVKSPLYAYLLVLIGMILSLLITFSTQIVSSHPYFIYSLLRSCKTGGATCLISGLSMGYLYNFIPIVVLSAFGFLCHFWMGKFGVAMGLMGISIYIPYYMYVNLYHSLMNTSSMITFINKVSEESITSLLKLNQSKKYFQQKNFIYFNQITTLLGYVIVAIFCQITDKAFSISDPHIFSGLIMGAMSPYVLSSSLIKSSFNVAPILPYDISQQIQQNPSIGKDRSQQIDFYRSNGLFLLNVILQIFRFIPTLILPNIVAGLALSPLSLVGFMAGLVVSAIQLSMSNSMCGSLWNNTKDQISYGRAKTQEDQEIAMDSQWGKAAEVGSVVGSSIRDCVGQSLCIFVFWTLITGLVFQDLYLRIHSD